jgi:hypothetical protein
MSPDQREGVFDARVVGGRLSEGIGRAVTCRANDREDKRLGAGAKRDTKPTVLLRNVYACLFIQEERISTRIHLFMMCVTEKN